MAIELNEPVVDALVSRLNSNLAATITTVNGEHSDDYDLDNPEQVLDYIPPTSLLTAFPTIGIGDGPSRFEDDIGASATGVHQVMVVVYLQEAEQVALARKLRRYAVAIARVILEDRNRGSDAWGTVLNRVDPGPTLADAPENPQTFMSWVGLTITAKRDEE